MFTMTGMAVLWFDVGIKRYTTRHGIFFMYSQLWFDVGIKRYTTRKTQALLMVSCGLM